MKTYLGLDKWCLAGLLVSIAFAYAVPPYMSLQDTLITVPFVLPIMWLAMRWFHKRHCQD